MKNNVIYYLIILVPLVLVMYALYVQQITLFVWGILIYVLIYRPIVDGYRLMARGIIQKSDFWKLFIPLYNLKWQRYCYFSKE